VVAIVANLKKLKMIENLNPNNFYSLDQMFERQKYIIKLKSDLLKKLKDLTNKIESEEPFPHGNMDFDGLCTIHDGINEILNAWYY
jgi:hypothetical protein